MDIDRLAKQYGSEASLRLGAAHTIVREQLPPDIRDKVVVDLRRDAHGLKTKARFCRHDAHTIRGRVVAECDLESMDFDGYSRMLKIPDVTLAHLCAVV